MARRLNGFELEKKLSCTMTGVDDSDEFHRPFPVNRIPGVMFELSAVSSWIWMDKFVTELQFRSRLCKRNVEFMSLELSLEFSK